MQTLRALRHAPSFSAAAIAAIALGTGAATLVFAVLYSLVLRPLPYAHPNRLVFIWIHDLQRNIRQEGVSYPTFLDWQAQNRAFAEIAVRGRGGDVRLTGAQPERLLADIVSANFFSVLGIPPVAGRTFNAAEENDGARVAVVSQRLAQRLFGSATGALGRPLELDREVWRVVGVMPTGYGILPADQDLWLPARRFPPLARFLERRSSDFFMGIARLRPGVTVAAAQEELNSIGSGLAIRHPIADPEFGGYATSVVPFTRQILGEQLPQSLWIAIAAVGLVLVVACANVANLLLARAVSRRHEFAVRSALGASTSQLIAIQLSEAGVLAVAGGAVGLVLAALGVQVLPLILPANLPRLAELTIHPATLAFAAGASAASALVFAAVPVWLQARRDPGRATARVGSDLATATLQPALVIAEFALALVLVAGAVLCLRTLFAIGAVDPGFAPQATLLFSHEAPASQPNLPYYRTLLARLQQIPGVEATGAITDFFIERNPDEVVTVEGRPTIAGEQVSVDAVSAGFLASIRARLLRGRLFTEADYAADSDQRPSAVIVNETFARRFFPGQEAVGQRVKFGTAEARGPWITIVGVVADLHRLGREQAAVSEAFGPRIGGGMDVVVRTTRRPERLIPAIRTTVRELDPNGLPLDISRLDDRLAAYTSGRRLQAWMIGSLSLLILFLAAVGVYGVLQYGVVQRRRELAIRLATGASPARIWRTVVLRGLGQALIGITLGLLLFAVAHRFLGSMVYGIGTLDPISLAGAVGILALTGGLACAAPAAAAARTDPAILLRD